MKTYIALIIGFSMWIVSVSAVWAEVKLGMLAQRGPETAIKEWGPLTEALGRQIGEKVVLVPLKFSEVRDFWTVNPDALMFTNPWFFVKAKVLKGAKPLVTVKYQGSGASFGGVIFTRSDSTIHSLDDIKGKVLMCPNLASPGGWLFQKGVLTEAGIVPEKDLKLILQTEKESHDQVVMAVLEGRADVGTVRTNMLETMQRERRIDMKDIRVLHPVQYKDFPEVCSTPLYPDWPVFALKNTPPEIASKVQQALLSMPRGDPVLEQARKIDRFVEALDYGPMEELCKLLKVEPFKFGR